MTGGTFFEVIFPYVMAALGFLISFTLIGIKSTLSELKTELAALRQEVFPRIAKVEADIGKLKMLVSILHPHVDLKDRRES